MRHFMPYRLPYMSMCDTSFNVSKTKRPVQYFLSQFSIIPYIKYHFGWQYSLECLIDSFVSLLVFSYIFYYYFVHTNSILEIVSNMLTIYFYPLRHQIVTER